MVGRCVGLHPQKGGRLSKGTQKQKAVGRTPGVATPACVHERITPAVYQFLSSLGIAATEAATAYTLVVGVIEKAQRDRPGMETLSKLKGVIAPGETSGDLRRRRTEPYRLMRELQERKKLQQLVSRTGAAMR